MLVSFQGPFRCAVGSVGIDTGFRWGWEAQDTSKHVNDVFASFTNHEVSLYGLWWTVQQSGPQLVNLSCFGQVGILLHIRHGHSLLATLWQPSTGSGRYLYNMWQWMEACMTHSVVVKGNPPAAFPRASHMCTPLMVLCYELKPPFSFLYFLSCDLSCDHHVITYVTIVQVTYCPCDTIVLWPIVQVTLIVSVTTIVLITLLF